MKSKVFIQRQSAITIQDAMNSQSRYIHFDRLEVYFFKAQSLILLKIKKIPA